MSPGNAASQHMRYEATRWADPDFLRSEAVDTLAPGFVRDDRRRLVGVGEADGPEYVAQQRAWAELGRGRHRLDITEVVAVCGERICLVRIRIGYDDGSGIDVLSVNRFDASVEKSEHMVVFDPDDLDAATAEFDRMCEELENG